ncbi:MAG: hypothetical protein IJE72_05700 [Clostridia bacterium]|nr:hypothetical protein [Clostridia bacterium]
MKKIFAVSLAFIMLFLCSCSDNNAASTPSDAYSETNTTASATESTKIITEWGTDLLPKKFPSPPEGTHDFSIVMGLAETAAFAYSTDFYRITFICPEMEIYSFSNELIKLGYKGGIKKFTDAEFYSNGYSGYWQNGENYIRISQATEISGGEIVFQIDIAECVDNFPKALEQFFPKFDGYCMSIGSYCAHDGNGNQITTDFDGSFAAPSWHWEFRFSNGFVGVEQEEFEKYCYSFENEDFQGVLEETTVDGCRILTADLTKTVSEGTYGVFMIYNSNLKTLDIAYTNDASIYIENE